MPKNYRKIPKHINKKIETFNSNYLEVGAILRVTETEILNGKLDQLGLTLNQIKSLGDINLTPPIDNGLASKKNLNGHVKVRKDLPKYLKAFDFEVPIWGDYSKGTNTITQYREVYPRDVYAPTNYSIKIRLLNVEDGDQKSYILKFKIDANFMIGELDFEKYLLSAINVLQENVGVSDVFELNASDDEYLKEEYLNWEIFPAGTKEEIFKSLLTGNKKTKSYMGDRVNDRYETLAALKPDSYIRGTNGFGSYFGALFDDDLVVFENVTYGNALYIIKDDWKKLSKLSRTELMKKYKGKFERIVHSKSWKKDLKETISRLKDSSI
ncbi:hypothetical protein [Halobacteriovorax sp. CON-3]|uniref:hypothetical protein n=1 Tax=Halobacteriovorax sp. CON-3 TaxID=3157710 RepID=UPI0037239282